MPGLFRPEAASSNRQRLLGEVIIAEPLSLTLLTAFLACAVTAIAILASLGSYARKVTVTGFLSPDKGIVRVHAPRPGIVGEILVEEGEHVDMGTPLLTLVGETRAGSGIDVDEEALRNIDQQLAGVDAKRQLAVLLVSAETKRLEAERDGLEAEARAIGAQLDVQRELVDQLAGKFERMRPAAERGFISGEEYLSREERLLIARQGLAGLVQKEIANEGQLRNATLALESLPLELEQRQTELQSIRAELRQRKAELEARRSIIITAPVGGTVTALRAITGESADTMLPLLTVLPDSGRLEAQLFVPTRAVGFVKKGQAVHLLYDAFDYRRYGVQSGSVLAISSSVFSPTETRLGTRIAEPTYRVTVMIDSQSVRADGQDFPLQAGMSLRADIVLEKRSLIDWLLDPLLSLRGRT